MMTIIIYCDGKNDSYDFPHLIWSLRNAKMSQRKEIGRRKGVTKAGHSHIFFSGIRDWESGILGISDWESSIKNQGSRIRSKIAQGGSRLGCIWNSLLQHLVSFLTTRQLALTEHLLYVWNVFVPVVERHWSQWILRRGGGLLRSHRAVSKIPLTMVLLKSP